MKTIERRDPRDLLEWLEEHIDGAHIERTQALWRDALDFKPVPYLPLSTACNVEAECPGYTIPEIHESMEAMLFNQLLACVPVVLAGDSCLPMIRANYGVGTIPSLFGCKCEIVGNNMPWVHPLESKEQIKKVISRGVPDLLGGYGARIEQTHAYYKEMLADYPKCRKYIPIHHSDVQGPFDVAHLIWGNEIYYELYDEPELVHALLEVVSDTLIAFLDRELTRIGSRRDGYCPRGNDLFKGNVTLCDDTSVNLSREMYVETSLVYNRKVAQHFGGAGLHFCGRADHWLEDLMEEESIQSVNFGYMDGRFDMAFLRKAYAIACRTKTPLVRYNLTDEEFSAFEPSAFPTGMTLVVEAGTAARAKEYIAQYAAKQTAEY